MSYIKTKTGENTITFDAYYQYIWARNYGETDVYISNHADIVAGDDDVALLLAGEAVRFIVNGNTLYVLGSTTLEVHAQNFSDSPFAWNEAGEGGGSDITVVALSATENKTYTAPTGTAYSPVIVSVSPNVGTKTITENGTYIASTDNLDGYSSVTVDTGIYTGTTTPANTLGKDGDYYYKRINAGYGIKNHQTPSSSQQKTLGYEFIPKTDIMLIGLRGYVNGRGYNYTVSIGTLSEILYTTESSTSSVSGWNKVVLDEPIKLNANQHYVVMVSAPVAGRYVSVENTTISDFITAVGGRYGTYPGTSDTDHLYLADIIFESDIYVVDKQYIKKSGSWVEL